MPIKEQGKQAELFLRGTVRGNVPRIRAARLDERRHASPDIRHGKRRKYMKITRRSFLKCSGAAAAAAALAACKGTSASTSASADASSTGTAQTNSALPFDNAKWNYDADNDIYWQTQVSYCAAPQAPDYETLGIYVPGAYLKGTANADGTYTCTVNADGTAGSYRADTAPVVIPVNTPGYAASAAPTDYSADSVCAYLAEGFIYLQPGIRGRSSMGGTAENESYSGGAPWGVTDIKAAIRYYRLHADELPGNADAVYTFGMSGGGAQSALTGATGDSALYTPYLEAIGAAMEAADGTPISDATAGAMCWCPITSLGWADAAYEWNMGQFFSSDVRADTGYCSALSKDLAAAYIDHLNGLKLHDGDTVLTLAESADGIGMAGSYYDYLLGVVETSLNHFLTDTAFPYTETATAEYPGGSAGMQGAGAGSAADGITGATAASGAAASGSTADGMTGATAASGSLPARGMGGAAGQMAPTDGAASGTGATYDTVQDYIDALNGDTPWITYDAASNTAAVSDMASFIVNCKNPTKGVGAFDEVDRGQGENNLFGNGQGESLHFDAHLAQLLSDNKANYAAFSDWQDSVLDDFTADLAQTDDLGTATADRVNMYDPMYYLSEAGEGYGSSSVAAHWRIRTGIDQSDTALTVETNLALALKAIKTVSDVDFETVWGMKHVMAERTGDSTTNFIEWVKNCTQNS